MPLILARQESALTGLDGCASFDSTSPVRGASPVRRLTDCLVCLSGVSYQGAVVTAMEWDSGGRPMGVTAL